MKKDNNKRNNRRKKSDKKQQTGFTFNQLLSNEDKQRMGRLKGNER